MAAQMVRVAAIGDLHCTKTSHGAFQPMFARIVESAEVLLLAGDLTDYGLAEEARVLAKELTAVRIPIVAVLGNHDIGRYPVSLVVHGHAHRGQPQGVTKTGVPVYNVSMPLLTRLFADKPPFRIFEVPAGGADATEIPSAAAPGVSRGRRATDAIAS